jgi:hypothetical protein
VALRYTGSPKSPDGFRGSAIWFKNPGEAKKGKPRESLQINHGPPEGPEIKRKGTREKSVNNNWRKSGKELKDSTGEGG